MSDETTTFLILGIVVAVFIWDHLPVAAVALGTALSLWATGVLTLEQSLAGFGDPTVVFIAPSSSSARRSTRPASRPGRARSSSRGQERAGHASS
jgi:hypothetical protein